MSEADRKREIVEQALDILDSGRTLWSHLDEVLKARPAGDFTEDQARAAVGVAAALYTIKAQSTEEMLARDLARERERIQALAKALGDCIPQLAQVVRHDVLRDLAAAVQDIVNPGGVRPVKVEG